MISIITISFNQSEYLERCINSISNQTNKNYEHIIIDAGSTDGSRELIVSYQKHFSHIIFEEDQGPADGLNKGFSLAEGDIYCFINSDDMLESNCIDIVENYFRLNPKIDIASGHSYIISANDSIRRVLYSDRYNLYYAGMNKSIISQQSTFFRSNIINDKKILFNIYNRIAWDYEFFLDCRLAGARFGLIPSILSSYRVYPGTITSSTNLRERTKEYEDNAFKKVYPKYLTRFKFIMKPLFSITRKIINYKDTLERIRKGPVIDSK